MTDDVTDATLAERALAANEATETEASFEAARENTELDLDRAIESILFVSDEPVPLVSLATAVSAPVRKVRDAVLRLVDDYDGKLDGPIRGFELREVGGGWRMYVRESFDEIVGDYVSVRQPSKLSQAALETLTVIAYRQPVSRSQVAQVRAVNVDSVVRTLLARGLITKAGHEEITGATLYVTTELLLQHLGINSLEELPKISPLLEDGRDGFDA
ncbi:SMC-Scp complex subunit ScpB [Gulosibacter molinativorax]|uniref:SMC-Scp complex subunit ScpB n=1 Tax=Gulosibacter molinativorax TaxID=256821 RepID=A0ABT7CB07_9MICO|nr:SMC-Scp complex subunit ScpB [Gulosibacter molinativorax]MDJ1372393.1 SMC-Scp complex subunit ScpB [Gulosibacter molinativorax]QUY61109.1 Segregation and condensation protein B [Gulosibacter molinativorax]